MRGRRGFTLVEIMIVVAIIGMLAMLALPSFVRARQTAQANACLNNLRQIDGAVEQWAIEHNMSTGSSPTWEDGRVYLKAEPKCPAGGTYEQPVVGVLDVECSAYDVVIHPATI